MSGLKAISPASLAAPLRRYSTAIEVPAGARYLFVSGQVGLDEDDRVPESAETQAEICFEKIRVILAEAGMDFSNIIRLGAFVTDREYREDYMRVRDKYVSDPPPTSTLFVITGFSRPLLKMEIECVAAKVDG
ncbi:enamine deaminase RidA [Mesorhizobium sp. Root102]|uniref:RidA family protein n=1 Tax=Mesorhizobium sp. Root102 TaxID=1736422 RepID=UPI0006F2673F|nr:RidA family protein [Mesorhizobium sp. Root102]KQU80100.1 enamine deaminase RidA [Mesorhizobium sp. Root102]